MYVKLLRDRFAEQGYLSAGQIAEQLGTTPGNVRKIASRRKIARVRVGNQTLYRLADFTSDL